MASAVVSQRLELVGRHEALDLGVLARRLQVLADGEEVDVGRAQVVHHLQHLLALLAQAHHDARLGEHGGRQLLHLLQQPQRGEVARARADLEIEPRHRLEVVVVDVGPRLHHGLDRALLAQEVGGEHLDGGRRRARPDGADGLREMLGAAVGEIVAVDRGDDDVLQASLAIAAATFSGSAGSSGLGSPVATLQKAQARVQVSPMIIMVAWRCAQHSPMLGQAASSHTVTRPCSRRTRRVSPYCARRRRHPHPDPVRLAQHRAYPAGSPSRGAAAGGCR